MPFSCKNGNYAQRIVAPVPSRRSRKSRGIENAFLSVVLGVNHNLAVTARGDPGKSSEVNRRGHYKAFSVIGVFTDQIDAARGNNDFRFGMETGNMQRTQHFGIVHTAPTYINSKSTCIVHSEHAPGSSSRDHGPVSESESTGAVAGSMATQACFGPGRSGHPP